MEINGEGGQIPLTFTTYRISQEITFTNMVDKHIEISIDEGAFFQIILNLLNNSMQILSPNKEIKIYVEEVDDFFVKLVYRNNGKPIPEELMGKIFSPLYTTKGRGEGIGLPISLKLMTRMGGSMKAVPPEDGIGAKFVLYIPNHNIK
jgi:signal transduction histidine kinase